jgi:hypothetical protein
MPAPFIEMLGPILGIIAFGRVQMPAVEREIERGDALARRIAAGGEQRYAADRGAWAALQHRDPAALPEHRDWRELLAALRRILRFTAQPGLEGLSEYLLASRTNDLLEAIRPELAFAGIPTSIGPTPEGVGGDLEEIVARLLATLNST